MSDSREAAITEASQPATSSGDTGPADRCLMCGGASPERNVDNGVWSCPRCDPPTSSGRTAEHGIDTNEIRAFWTGTRNDVDHPSGLIISLCDALDRQREELAGAREEIDKAVAATDRAERDAATAREETARLRAELREARGGR